MNANELMLGDLVTFKDCQNDEHPTIVKIWQINANGDMLVSIDGCDVLDEISIDDEIAGIPLTSEILEKNGFKQGEGFENRWYITEFNDWYFSFYRSNTFWSLLINKGIFPKMNNIYINYVHELQHALRLCGIEKEIEL